MVQKVCVCGWVDIALFFLLLNAFSFVLNIKFQMGQCCFFTMEPQIPCGATLFHLCMQTPKPPNRTYQKTFKRLEQEPKAGMTKLWPPSHVQQHLASTWVAWQQLCSLPRPANLADQFSCRGTAKSSNQEPKRTCERAACGPRDTDWPPGL